MNHEKSAIERRETERFFLGLPEKAPLLVLDEAGNGYETVLHNISVGGLSFELVQTAVWPNLQPPEFGLGSVFQFAKNNTDRWGDHLEGRLATVVWKDGHIYGLTFDRPLGSVPKEQPGGTDQALPSRVRHAMLSNTDAVPFFRRLRQELAKLLGTKDRD